MYIALTISLLASNRTASLERCLDSIKPLLVKIPCELIIVLTNTDADVKKIAENYTPQLIPFKWCNDFSAARNIGLKSAQGEWFLYIDDDEWFDDVDEICQFFLSGEYRHYNSAHYIQRNYQNWEGTKYSDFSAFRMIKRISASHFQGEIHEELTPRIAPCKYFQTFVHHYGYVTDSANSPKAFRNIPMLLQSIERHPKQIKNYLQIAKEFGLEGNWKAAEKYCRIGLDICQKSKDSYSMGWLQAYLAYLTGKAPGKTPAIQEIINILNEESPSELVRLILYQQLIYLYFEAQESEQVVRYGWKFENLLDEMDSQAYLWKEQSYGEFCENYVKNPERLYGTRTACVASALELQEQKSAAYFLKRFPWDTEEILGRYYSDFEKWKTKYAAPYVQILFEILQDIMISFNIPEVSCIYKYPDIQIPIYLLLQKSLDSLSKEINTDGLNLFIYCILHTDNAFLQQQLFKEGIRHQINVMPLAEKMDLDTWNICTAKAIKELSYDLNNQLCICEAELHEKYYLHSLCLKRRRLEQKLNKGFLRWPKLIETLEEYCLCTLDFYRGLYRKDLLCEERIGLLPCEIRFSMTALNALEKLKQEKMAEAVRLFGDGIHIYPDMTGVITEVFRQTARRMDNPMLHAGNEFLQLAEKMKETLKILMDANQTSQASEILAQLLPLMPEDLELIWTNQELIRRAKLCAYS